MGRKEPYIPHLAEFYFKPTHDWDVLDAKELYYANKDKPEFNKVYNENCLITMQNMIDRHFKVNLIIADPPFGLDFSGKESVYNRDEDNVVDGYVEIPLEDYEDISNKWIKLASQLLEESGSMYIISGWTNLKYILNAISDTDLTLMNHIIWKYNFGVFTSKKFVSAHYHILYLVKNPKKYFYNRITHYNEDVWTIDREYNPNKLKNGTKLPQKLIQKIIDFSSEPGDIIYDPFLGNGTTIEVAKKCYRCGCGSELNSNAINMIINNINTAVEGEFYTKTYTERLPTHEELSKINAEYKRAYNIYLDKKQTI